MRDELLSDLPGDLPTFLKRFGSDARCRAYLVRARWPAGFRCERCGHDQAYSHKKRLIEECAPAASSTRSWPARSSSRPRPASRAGSWRSTW